MVNMPVPADATDCCFPLPADAMEWTREDEEPIDESSLKQRGS